jgi:long-subunit acyl-CoA synthetase (AMP-forming)
VKIADNGEILVSAPWVSDGYLDLWDTQQQARLFDGDVVWHRSGDVGHFDDAGRLWVEGRTVHVIHSESGPITPVPVERAVERGSSVARSAAVGVGPVGVQQLVVVLEDPASKPGLASTSSTDEVRRLVARPVAAVLTLRQLPVDIRHNAKIDRTAVAGWAEAVLAGRRARPPK